MNPTRVAVIGAGTMGHGIAYVAALAGCEVRLTDARADALPQALDKIEALLVSGVKRGKLAAEDHAAMRKRIRPEPQIRPAVSDADIVIEAIVEDIEIKQRLFADVERAAPPGALLASNTSSLSSGEDIDKAMELGYNHPMGPLKLTDLVGLDVRLAIAECLHATLGKPQYEPPKILKEKVKKGELGKKTGKGFYTWSD